MSGILNLAVLAAEFFKTGLFAVGGGLATLPFLYNMADKYPWFDRTQLADMIAVSESTPGPIGVNMSTYAGFNAGGILGGIISTCSLVIPSIIIIIIVAKFLNKFSENFYVKSAFYGLRPAVTALIAAASVEIIKISILSLDAFSAAGYNLLYLFNLKSLIIFVPLVFVVFKWKPHPIFCILGAAVLGIILKL